ncbi:MAG: hypothetical protein JWP44_2639, partial [Mucilaginibacter sp.]|nr:hypothetical protein [Mucilaginibacter sp.]
AMTKVAAQTGMLSFAFDPIIAIETAASIALIAAQSPPQFAKGGVIQGPSHADGGVPLINGYTGMPVAEVEGDETVAVFSKQTTANNGQIISDLLYNSQYRNGAPVTVNTAQAVSAMRYANGGMLPQFNNNAGVGKQSEAGGSATGGNDDVVRLLGMVHDKLDDLGKRPIEFNNRAYEQYTTKVAAIRGAANA